MNCKMPTDPQFVSHYEKHVKCLKLNGQQPKTIEAYSRALKRVHNYFQADIAKLSSDQLLNYFSDLLDSHSWSTVKLDLYGLKFFYTHVLDRPWQDLPLIKPPKTSRIPDILSVEQVSILLAATNIISYKVFFFTIYSLVGLRISEGIDLKVGDIDKATMRVHIRSSTGKSQATRTDYTHGRYSSASWSQTYCKSVDDGC